MSELGVDVMADKLDEFDKYPALTLGLDGWILRSLPTELRARFLTGYEKLLQIAFHPDRYQDPALKESRDRYLRSVSEAIVFLLSGNVEYATAVDDVPTRRNPLIRMQFEINRQSETIVMLDAARIAPIEQLKEARADWQKQHAAMRQAVEESKLEADNYRILNDTITEKIAGRALPITRIRDRITVKNLDLSEVKRILDHDVDIGKFDNCYGKTSTIEFKNGSDNTNHRRCIGSMDKSHLLQLLAKDTGLMTRNISEVELNELKGWLRWKLLRVFSTDTLLLFLKSCEVAGMHRLECALVVNSEGLNNPYLAENNSLTAEVSQLKLRVITEHRAHSEAAKKLRGQITEQKQKCSKLRNKLVIISKKCGKELK